LFISIHANHCGTPATRGTETFVLGLHRSNDNLDVAKKENSVILLEDNYDITYEGFDPNSPESYIMFEMAQDVFMDQSLSFADAVQQQFKAKIGTPDRGVKQAGFLVLRQSSMPSVLIELGFLSNQTEANYLNSDSGQENLSRSIFEAFRKFKVKNSTSVPTEKTRTEPALAKNQAATPAKEPVSVKKEIVETKKTEPKPEEQKPDTTADQQKAKSIVIAKDEPKVSSEKKPVETESATIDGT